MTKRKTLNQNNGQLSFRDYELPEVSVRLVLKETSSLYSSTPLKTPEDAVRVMGDLLREMDREMVCAVNIAMDNKLRPINYTVVSLGDISSSIVPVGSVFKSALLQNAAAMCVMVLHNHPSGDATPSKEDFDVTKRLVQAGKLLSIPVIDHIVVGAYQGEMFSFRSNYPDMFYPEPDLSIFPEIDPGKGWCASEKKESYVAEKPSVIGRLKEKQEKVAPKGSKEEAKKMEYSLG